MAKYLRDVTPLIVEGWTKHKAGHYSACVSDIEGHVSSGKNVRCPSCRKPVTGKDAQKHERHDLEGEVTHWDGNCRHCNSKLTVWND